MKKIKITQQQYNSLILAEQKRIESNNLIFENEGLLEEGWKEIVLGIAMLSGLNLGAQTNDAEAALKNKQVVQDIKDVVQNKQGIADLATQMKKMKIQNVDNVVQQISNNAKTFENNFEDISPEDYKTTKSIVINNLKSLPGLVKSGYSVKGIEHSVDTIKGQKEVKEIIVRDTIDFKMENMGQMFVSGKYELSKAGVDAIKDNLKFLKDSGFTVLSVEIISSTDKQRIASLKSTDEKTGKKDETGNVKLAQLRANSVLNVIKSDEIIGKAPIKIIPKPNEGETSAEAFKAAENTPQEKILQNKEQPNRFVTMNIVVEKTISVKDGTTKPDLYVDKFKIEVIKNYEETHKVVNINRKSPKIFKKIGNKCTPKDSGVAKCTF